MSGSSKTQEMNDTIRMLQNEIKKYKETEIFKDIILETVADKSNGLRHILRTKIRDIILRGELVNNLKVNNADEHALLDIEEFTNLELTFDEKKELQIAVEQKIKEKKDSILKDFNDISENDLTSLEDLIENVKFDEKTEQENIIEEERQLKELQEKHKKSILEYGELLLKLLELKTEKAPELMTEKSENLFLESEKTYLRSKILDYKSKISVFTDSSMSLEAYQMAYKDLLEKQKSYAKEIEELKSDLIKYGELSKNQEYMDILDKYKQYLKTLENQKWLQKTLFNK